MRHNRANVSGDRSNALWGRGSRNELRSNALWGRGGRRAGAAVATLVLTLAFMAAAAVADNGGSGSNSGSSSSQSKYKAYFEPSLLSAIQQNPSQTFDVIVMGDKQGNSNGLFKKLVSDSGSGSGISIGAGSLKDQFNSINGLHLTLRGSDILKAANRNFVTAILANESVKTSAVQLPLTNSQLWPWATGAPVDWLKQSPDAATIAVVDSGIDPSRTADFGSRLLAQVNMTSLGPNSPGDGYGHGTFVAGIAAGGAPGYAGAAPKADLVSLDVMNDQGQATVGDVVRAADWILANKAKYNIKVANFSLHAVNRASILFDPLDQAVERLWLNGIVVVAAAGNYGTPGTPSGVPFAPGNDPFVITVGAADIGTTLGAGDDTAAPFSAYGYTGDGFAKPDLAAPGRYMIGPVPASSTLPMTRPDHVTAPGYMMLSGTSFAAPVVAAAAATLMAQHPNWTPDQVKGSLMVTATPTPMAPRGSLGVGELNIAAARARALFPPNPNAGLNQFLKTAADGTRTFDAPAWQAAAKANKAWDAAAWSDVAWSDAAWSSVAWSDAAWADAAWASVAWGDAAWSDVAWSDAAWSDAAWADNASDPSVGDAADATSTDMAAALAALGIVDASCDPIVSLCIAPGSLLP
jgi:serine protease AprX